MKINIVQPILDYENKPLMTNKLNEKGKPILDSQNQPEMIPETSRNYIATALNNAAQNEVFTADQKNQIYQLSNKLYAGNEVDLTPTERNLIKERIEKHYSPLICGRINEILYPEDKVTALPSTLVNENHEKSAQKTPEEIAAEVRTKGEK